MPLYEFKCQACEQLTEPEWASVSELDELKATPCPYCGGQLETVLAPVGMVKGHSFYNAGDIDQFEIVEKRKDGTEIVHKNLQNKFDVSGMQARRRRVREQERKKRANILKSQSK